METPRKNPTEADRQRIRVENEALLFLEGLSGTVGTPRRLRPGTRNLVRYVVAPSLLSAFAEMFLEDAELGRRALRCDTCGMFFVSDEPHARYCSVRCRNTMPRVAGEREDLPGQVPGTGPYFIKYFSRSRSGLAPFSSRTGGQLGSGGSQETRRVCPLL